MDFPKLQHRGEQQVDWYFVNQAQCYLEVPLEEHVLPCVAPLGTVQYKTL